MHRLWLRNSGFQLWRQHAGVTQESPTGLQDRGRQGFHPRATLIPGAHPARGAPEMRAAASPARSKMTSVSKPES